MIRLAVADFDGTLREYGEPTPSLRVREMLDQLTEKGVTLAISSGRTYTELAQHFQTLRGQVYFICCDGAYLVKDDRLLYERRIAHEDLRLFDKAHTDAFSYVLHGAYQNYCVGRLPQDAVRYQPTAVPSSEAVREPIYKVTAYGDPPRLPPYCGLRSHWDGGEVSMSQYVNRFCNKGTALSDLQSRLMLTKFDTACIGDSGNDIAMMHNAKLTVCVGSRCPELAKACTCSADTPETALQALLDGIGK